MNKTINEVYIDYYKYLKLNYKETTTRLIDFKFKNYILPFLGNLNINDISTTNYLDFQLYLKKFNYSNSFYEQIHSMCKKFFEYLSTQFEINNIASKIDIKRANNSYNSSQTKGTFSIKEYKKFINSVDNKVYHALFNVLFYCGLRKGEALALKITDFKNDCLYINHTITTERFNGERLITTPKTKKSNRIIRLDYFTRRELKRLIKYYSMKYNNFNNNFFLFGGDKPIACTTLERKKNEYCKKAGVKQIRIHDFRHSHATMLYNKRIKIKLIQERLGHSDISTTLNTYVHTNKKQEKRLTNKINLIRL